MAAHRIVHVELSAQDPAAAGAFYAELFGWKLQPVPEDDYLLFEPPDAPGGGFVRTGSMGFQPGEVLIYVATDDIDATLQRAEALGGQTLVPQTEIPNIGWFGIFRDPAGNRIGLFTPGA